MPEIKAIGYVSNNYNNSTDMHELRQKENTIIVKQEFAEGLYKIEDRQYLKVIFYFHKSTGYNLKGKRRHGQIRGVFASRSPHRPGQVGVTTVRLIKREGNKLIVQGLDALDETPVLDIKPYAPFLDGHDWLARQQPDYTPRREIEEFRDRGQEKELLWRAGKLHGHYCPFLSLGVKAATHALNKLGKNSRGMEELLAIVETNSCFSDGIQYVSGCTLGNNALIYRDFGKTAVTFTNREDQGWRLYFNRNNLIKNRYPEASNLFEKVIGRRQGNQEEERLLRQKWKQIAFDLIENKARELFKIERVELEIPDYAPVFEDEICDNCGEKIMSAKAVKMSESTYCIPCARSSYLQLDGRGLIKINRE